MVSSQYWVRPLVVIAAISALLHGAFAATLILDPAQSSITLAGKAAGFTLRQQGPGSLTTTVGGTIDVISTGNQLQITSATLDPNVNGNWKPGRSNQSTSPADLAGSASTGLFGDVQGALRDLLLTASSSPRPINPDGTFDAGAITFAFPANSNSTFDYDSFLAKGSKVLSSVGTNQTATVGQWVDHDGVQTLTLALNATFYFSLVADNDTLLTLTGQLVAKSPAPSGPKLGGFQIVNGQVHFNLSGGSDASGIESTTNLVQWAPVQATPAAGPNGTKDFALPVSGPITFYRAKQ